ncbi:MAG: zinc-binding dehydrogenase, partial [Armatimonadota bacterium]
SCKWCLRGQENLCETIMSTKVLGSYAEYLLVPARVARLNLFPKPSSLPFSQAALLEPLACVAQGVSLLPWVGQGAFNERVLVIGPGAIGLMFVAALRRMGITDITLAGRNEERLAIGKRLGASTAPYTDLAGEFDIVIECTGNLEVWQKSMDFVGRGGTLMLFGGLPGGSKATFDATRLHYDQVSLVSPFHFGSAAVKMAREWLVDTAFDLSPLISGTRKLEEADSVFRDLEAGKGIKYVFEP